MLEGIYTAVCRVLATRFSLKRSREQWYYYCSRDRFWENRVARTLQTALSTDHTVVPHTAGSRVFYFLDDVTQT